MHRFLRSRFNLSRSTGNRYVWRTNKELHWIYRERNQRKGEKCGFPPAEGRKRRKTFFSHAAGSVDSSAWGSQVMWERLPSDIAWHPPTHPPTHAWSISRVGLSLWFFSFASLPKFECNFFRWNQLLIMYSFLLVFLDSVSSSWPVFVLLYLSLCVNKGQAACSAWHGSQLCVRNDVSLILYFAIQLAGWRIWPQKPDKIRLILCNVTVLLSLLIPDWEVLLR